MWYTQVISGKRGLYCFQASILKTEYPVTHSFIHLRKKYPRAAKCAKEPLSARAAISIIVKVSYRVSANAGNRWLVRGLTNWLDWWVSRNAWRNAPSTGRVFNQNTCRCLCNDNNRNTYNLHRPTKNAPNWKRSWALDQSDYSKWCQIYCSTSELVLVHARFKRLYLHSPRTNSASDRKTKKSTRAISRFELICIVDRQNTIDRQSSNKGTTGRKPHFAIPTQSSTLLAFKTSTLH